MKKRKKIINCRHYRQFISELNTFIDREYHRAAGNFAAECGIGGGHLSEIRRLKKEPSVEVLQLLSEKSGIPIDIDRILSPEARILSPDAPASNERPKTSDVIEFEHIDLIKRFQNKELARSINRDLLEIERIRPEALERAAEKIRTLLEGMLLLVEESVEQYGPRRRVERRRGHDPDKPPQSGDRRSGSDRRKASGS
ncbi:MAG: hypothetical protein ACOWWM_09545 [Desulfobacterales bacterium]